MLLKKKSLPVAFFTLIVYNASMYTPTKQWLKQVQWNKLNNKINVIQYTVYV